MPNSGTTYCTGTTKRDTTLAYVERGIGSHTLFSRLYRSVYDKRDAYSAEKGFFFLEEGKAIPSSPLIVCHVLLSYTHLTYSTHHVCRVLFFRSPPSQKLRFLNFHIIPTTRVPWLRVIFYFLGENRSFIHTSEKCHKNITPSSTTCVHKPPGEFLETAPNPVIFPSVHINTPIAKFYSSVWPAFSLPFICLTSLYHSVL